MLQLIFEIYEPEQRNEEQAQTVVFRVHIILKPCQLVEVDILDNVNIAEVQNCLQINIERARDSIEIVKHAVEHKKENPNQNAHVAEKHETWEQHNQRGENFQREFCVYLEQKPLVLVVFLARFLEVRRFEEPVVGFDCESCVGQQQEGKKHGGFVIVGVLQIDQVSIGQKSFVERKNENEDEKPLETQFEHVVEFHDLFDFGERVSPKQNE